LVVENGNPGFGHVVISTGNEINKKTRPTNAGLKGFFPSPPKDILATPIDIIAPTINIHIGRLVGTLNAKSTPVIIAEPSEIVGSPFKIYFCINHSNKRQEATDTKVRIMALNPK
jgi:hypothetical protein